MQKTIEVFLADDHTLQHFRQQMWFPSLFDRGNRERWESEGSKTLGQKLNEKVLSILRTHRPTPLSADALAQIDSIIREHEANAL